MPRDAQRPQNFPQAQNKPSDSFDRDLSPDHMAGQNIGTESAGDRIHMRFAGDIKELVNFLSSFSKEELRQIPVVTTGERLSQGRTYLDLTSDDREPFTATGNMSATDGHYFVPKAETPHMFWNRLIRAEPRERQQ